MLKEFLKTFILMVSMITAVAVVAIGAAICFSIHWFLSVVVFIIGYAAIIAAGVAFLSCKY